MTVRPAAKISGDLLPRVLHPRSTEEARTTGLPCRPAAPLNWIKDVWGNHSSKKSWVRRRQVGAGVLCGLRQSKKSWGRRTARGWRAMSTETIKYVSALKEGRAGLSGTTCVMYVCLSWEVGVRFLPSLLPSFP